VKKTSNIRSASCDAAAARSRCGAPGGNIRVGYIFRTDRGLAFVDRPGVTCRPCADQLSFDSDSALPEVRSSARTSHADPSEALGTVLMPSEGSPLAALG